MSEHIIWRGSAHIRTSDALTGAVWPLGCLILSVDSLEIRAAWLRLVLIPHDIVELQFYHMPIPRFIAISHSGGRYAMASFCVFNGKKLKQVLNERGFEITTESRWRQWGKSTIDHERFGLRSDADG